MNKSKIALSQCSSWAFLFWLCVSVGSGISLVKSASATSNATSSGSPRQLSTPPVLGKAESTIIQIASAIAPSARPAVSYDELYPEYAEFCGASQRVRKAVNGEPASVGGSFGHGFFYLRGACRDLSAPYPQIHVCS